jgi:hypothetical protein
VKTLLKETKLGKLLSMGVNMEKDEVGLFIASQDVSCGCGFKFKEWEKFVEGVNAADEKYKKQRK